MPARFATEDLLPHIESPAATSGATNLMEAATAVSGCLNLFSAFGCTVKVCYAVNLSDVTVTAELDTPVGNVNLGSATLDPSNPTIKLGGHIGGFKAEVTIGFEVSSMTLTIEGSVCAPLVGCKTGKTSVVI